MINTCSIAPSQDNFWDDDILHCFLWVLLSTLLLYFRYLSGTLKEKSRGWLFLSSSLRKFLYRNSEMFLTIYSTVNFILTILWFNLCPFIVSFQYWVRPSPTLQMKGWWESNINVWFPFMYSHKWNCYFLNMIIMFRLPVPTLIDLWEIYISRIGLPIFCCRDICGPILGIHKSLTDIRMWKLGLRPRNAQKRNT